MNNNLTNDQYWYWLNNAPGIGRLSIANLLEEFETAKNIYNEDNDNIIKWMELSGNKRFVPTDYINSKCEETIIYNYERLNKNKVSFIHPESDNYPEKLRNIPDPPYGLYLKGMLPDDDKPSIAIIGSRNSTHYGREMARVFGRELAKNNVTVISGLARGIDGMAHRGAIEAGCYTLGVLGCGIDIVYPQENYDLFIEMEKTGGIISESDIGIKPYAGLFPQRNRIISGMADGILVVEAREKSGTFITVDQGLDQGKDIFAIPGRLLDPNSKGCNNLIKMGAHFVTEISDILEVITDYVPDEGSDLQDMDKNVDIDNIKNSLAPPEKIVYSVLSVEPKYIDDIIKQTLLSPGEVCMYINRLAVMGVIVEPARNYYSIRL